MLFCNKYNPPDSSEEARRLEGGKLAKRTVAYDENSMTVVPVIEARRGARRKLVEASILPDRH
jgi:hypothetical protein